ncbi:MAG TPA: MFS transporter [Streptosporangiaceae bacterium]
MPRDDPGPWRRMRLWATAHAIDDMYQGLVPASVPYFVLDRHYSYVAASGLALAATLGSSLPQPVIGLLVDKWRLGWMAAAGVSLAGVSAGLSGLAPAYPMVWLLLLASGLGVAMFHPAAGKSARVDAGGSASAMSIFAAGGSAGFFLAPVLATPALVSLGLGATTVFIPPAVLIGLFLLRHHQRALAGAAAKSIATGPDRWAPFLVMTGVEIVRSVVFFGVNTFIELYWIHHLGASRGAAGLATNISFSVMIKLGQDYLPSRPGTATGVTLGLAVSIGGLFAPVLGAIAEARGIAAVFTVLCFVPGLALILGAFLPDPAAPVESTEDARSRRAPAGRCGTPRSPLPGRNRGR